ncbi:fumarylacetoacetate hydrolase family protein [Nocardia sp. NPDC004860]|uniref:fumarylacetoacetate hydrolase family protein n=1 Tax=Nocardia sp. NPDC004860 TaxID=3154557 RepID=UPI0033A0A877
MSSQRWCLVQFVENNRAEPSIGVLADGKVCRAPQSLSGRTLLEVVDRWEEFTPLLRNLQLPALEVAPDAELIAPLTYPRKILCAGANYYGHAQEMGTQRPDPDAEPFFFLKPPTTTVVGAHDDVRLPDNADVDWEAELAVVIGTGGRDIDERTALEHVAGYTVANDLSARGRFPRKDAVLPPFGWDWFQHKAFDGSCPLGPGIVPGWQIGDPHDLTIRLTVNGEIKQEASTADMVITVPRLIAAASRVLTLEPGDVILTGTPAGVGMPHKTFLRVGDLVVTEIDGIGRLENAMVAS